MIALNLLRHIGARQGAFVAVSVLLFGLFQFLICTAVARTNMGGALETLIHSLPPFVQAALATQFPGGLSEGSLLAFGWNHPVSHALGAAVAILLAARAVAGEIETGAVELLLSQPLSRGAYLATQVTFALLALALLSLAGMIGTLAGQAVSGSKLFGAGRLLHLALNYCLLQGAWFGLVLALSASGREGGRIASAGFLLALVTYFAQAIGRLWSEASFVLPWTLQHYFSPQGILLEEVSPFRPLTTLLAVLLAGLGVAAWRFQHRDLP